MDRTQVVSLVLLLALVFALVLDGTRAFSEADVGAEEVQAPTETTPVTRPDPATPGRHQPVRSPHERRLA